MKTLYLDHNIIAKSENWDDIRACLEGNHGIRLVLSFWNLYEIGLATDLAQKEARARFLDSLNPMWLPDLFGTQRDELARYLAQAYFKQPAIGETPLQDSLAHLVLFQLGRLVRPTYSISDFVRKMEVSHDDLIALNKARGAEALAYLQTHKKDAKKIEKSISRLSLLRKLQIATPTGEEIDRDQAEKILDFCEANEDALHKACPAIFVEGLMSEKRTSNPTRVPSESDMVDLMHGTLAAAYCDFIVTGDRFLRSCIDRASTRLSAKSMKTPAVFARMSDLRDFLDARV